VDPLRFISRLSFFLFELRKILMFFFSFSYIFDSLRDFPPALVLEAQPGDRVSPLTLSFGVDFSYERSFLWFKWWVPVVTSSGDQFESWTCFFFFLEDSGISLPPPGFFEAGAPQKPSPPETDSTSSLRLL